jgi:hypothetical protein
VSLQGREVSHRITAWRGAFLEIFYPKVDFTMRNL